jgi:hypothetical protein
MESKLRLLVSVCLALMVLAPAASAQTPEYRHKEEKPRTGTLLIRDAPTRSEVALNRTYDELTPEDKAIVHGWYEYIAPGDEPPFPIDGLGPIYKAIDRGRNIAPGQGDLYLAVTVGPDGKAREVQVLKSPGTDISEFVASILLLTKYKPALCDGQKCQMQFPLYVTLKQLNNFSSSRNP